jgi:hypothetical protein
LPGILTLGNLLKAGLTSKEVRAMLLISEGSAPSKVLLQRWSSTGLVRPSVLSVGRQGRWNLSLYSWGDYAALRLIVRLRREGLTMLKVKAAFAYLGPQLLAALVEGGSSSIQVLRNGQCYVTTPESEFEVPSGQTRLRFELAAFAQGNREVRDRVRLAA